MPILRLAPKREDSGKNAFGIVCKDSVNPYRGINLFLCNMKNWLSSIGCVRSTKWRRAVWVKTFILAMKEIITIRVSNSIFPDSVPEIIINISRVRMLPPVMTLALLLPVCHLLPWGQAGNKINTPFSERDKCDYLEIYRCLKL